MEHVIAKHGTREYVSHLSPKKAKSEALKKKKEEKLPRRTHPLHGRQTISEEEWQHGVKTGSFPDVKRGRK